MDFEKLIYPYREKGRTIGLQIKWLTGKAMPHDAIDYAMSKVYKEIELGRTFEDGTTLDHELLTVAKEYHLKELHEQMVTRLESIEQNLDAVWNTLGKARKIWEVIRGRA